VSVTPEDFPPQDIRSFLEFCAGEWLALRSRFDLGSAQAGVAGSPHNDEEAWHDSQRGELLVAFLEPARAGDPGGLRITPPGAATQELHFLAGGQFQRGPAGTPEAPGQWQLGPDGSLELSLSGREGEVRERIWFTKPNLRLRSSVEHRRDGSPGRASFSSEIRRVSRPSASSAATPSPA
jgi:hypothetical protein